MHALSNVLVTLFRYWRTSQWSGRDFRLAGIWTSSHSSDMSRYVMPVTVSTAKKRMDRALLDWKLHKTHWLQESHLDAPHRHWSFQIPIFWHCDDLHHCWRGMSLRHWTAPFPRNNKGNSLSLVTENRNQAGACDLHPRIIVPFGCGMF